MTQPIICAVPTHILFGFLGAGKTTLLNHLLAQKPDGETWAVLSNELGQVDIDQTFIASPENADTGSIVIKQVIGGCICCTSYLPMQIALSRLLSQAKPDRLFIEVTGLGHPALLIQQLGSSHWATALSLRAVLTVMNGSNLYDQRLLTHDVFQAQITHADLIIVSHSEAMQPKDHNALHQLKQQAYYQQQPCIEVSQGKLLFEYINQPHQARAERQQISYIKTGN